jgi:hypothetical protein
MPDHLALRLLAHRAGILPESLVVEKSYIKFGETKIEAILFKNLLVGFKGKLFLNGA